MNGPVSLHSTQALLISSWFRYQQSESGLRITVGLKIKKSVVEFDQEFYDCPQVISYYRRRILLPLP